MEVAGHRRGPNSAVARANRLGLLRPRQRRAPGHAVPPEAVRGGDVRVSLLERPVAGAVLDDLAQTTLPQRSPVWRRAAATFVFLWPQELKPDPKENAGVVLVYDNAGLFTKLGRKSV